MMGSGGWAFGWMECHRDPENEIQLRGRVNKNIRALPETARRPLVGPSLCQFLAKQMCHQIAPCPGWLATAAITFRPTMAVARHAVACIAAVLTDSTRRLSSPDRACRECECCRDDN